MLDIDDVDEAKRMLPIYKRAVDVLETVSGKKTEQAEQEPVAYAAMINGEIAWDADYPFSNEPFTCFDDEQAVPLYAAPVRTKDLTDDEIMKINVDTAGIVPTCDRQFHFARAVIAADREKNK